MSSHYFRLLRWSAALFLFATANNVAAVDMPNIVFILADDLGYGDVGPYKLGSSPIPTPNIDTLASQGMTFTEALAPASVCAPTRYSTLTGNYPFRARKRWGVYEFNQESNILPGQETIADALQGIGYATAFVGKMHLGGDFYRNGSNNPYRSNDPLSINFGRRFDNGPLDHGFDESLVLTNGIQASIYGYFVNDLYRPLNAGQPDIIAIPAGTFNGGTQIKDGYGDPNWDSRAVGPRLAQNAVDFIGDHYQAHGTNKPFFLYYASQSLHRPYTPPATLGGMAVAGVTGVNAKADMIYELDLQVGAILAELDRLNLTDDTLVIFTSDNGGTDEPAHLTVGHDPVGGLRGFKTGAYEGSLRVPFIAKWGDGTVSGSNIAPGTSSSHLISVQDWVAAMYALTGQAIANDQVLDSVNILPIMLGQQAAGNELRTEMVFQAANWGSQNKYRGIRVNKWTLILDVDDNPLELYNLNNDLVQQNNLINSPAQSGRIATMLGRYDWAVKQSSRTVPVDDTPPPPADPTLSIASEVVDETAGSVTFDVRLSVAAQNTTSVRFATNDRSATAGQDYAATSGDLVFNIGDSVKSFAVPIFDDLDTEGNESFEVVLSNPVNADLGTATATGTIVDDEAAVCGQPDYASSAVSAAALWKDCQNGIWHVRFVASPSGGVVRFNGNIESTLGFGQISPVSLESNDVLDTQSDPGLISYMLRVKSPWFDGFSFSTPAGASLCFDIDAPGNAIALVGPGNVVVDTPFDPDTLGPCNAATPALIIADSSASEASESVILNVLLSPASTEFVTVNYASVDGTATAGEDYQAVNGTLLFNAGDTSAAIEVPLLNDDSAESSEDFTIELSDPLGAPLGRPVAVATIVDDDTSSCGIPSYDPAIEKAMFIWQDCTSGLWTVRMAAGGSYTRYEGNITSSAALDNLATFSLEDNDLFSANIDQTQLTFRLAVTGRWEDGFSFAANPAEQTCVSLSSPFNASVLVGTARTPVSQPFDLRTLGPCQ